MIEYIIINLIKIFAIYINLFYAFLIIMNFKNMEFKKIGVFLILSFILNAIIIYFSLRYSL